MNKKLKLILSILFAMVLMGGIIFLLIPKTPEPIHVDPIPPKDYINAQTEFNVDKESPFCVEKTKVQDCDTTNRCCDFSME